MGDCWTLTIGDQVIFYLYRVWPGHRAGVRRLQRDPSAPEIEVLSYDEVLSRPTLRRGTYIFTDLDRLSTAALIEAARLFRRLRENGCRALNDPARVRTRFALLRALHESGLNPINAYPAEEGSRPERFPVFIRIADAHEGPLSGLIWDQATLDDAIEAAVVAGVPRSTILTVEYAAQPIRPGVFRKSSFYRVGDHYISDVSWYGKTWRIKGDRDGLADPELYAKELQLMRENPYGKDLARVFDLANIDYGRLDFGVIDERPCVYEINTNPELFGPRFHPVAERAEGIGLRWAKLLAAFHAIDTKPDPSQKKVEVGGTSLDALQEAGAISPALFLHDLRLSQEHARRGNLSAALQFAEAAVVANPDNVKALANLSRILARLNRTNDAIAVSQRVVQVSPRRTPERRYLAKLLQKAGRFQEARDQLLAALDLSEGDWKTHLALSRVYRQLDDFERERDQLSKARALKGDDWHINLLLSRAYTKLGDDAAALGAVRRASELAPNQPEVAERLQRLSLKAAETGVSLSGS